MAGTNDYVERLQSGQIDFHVNGMSFRVNGDVAERLCLTVLGMQGWEQGTETGLQVGEVTRVLDELNRRDMSERLKASGTDLPMTNVVRAVMHAPWKPEQQPPAASRSPKTTDGKPRPAPPPVRRFTKQVAAPPTAPVKSVKKQPAKLTSVPPVNEDLPKLFDDPELQLRYEAHHQYLLTVPPSQRSQWGWHADYKMLPTFLEDVEAQVGYVSRQQVLSAIVDVVSGRYRQVNSREPRPLRKGGGTDSRPAVVRSFDGALAWRANVSHGTPAARRIMWWAPKDGNVELARFATHDDVAMPER